MEILGQPTSFENVKNLGEIANYLHYNFDAPWGLSGTFVYNSIFYKYFCISNNSNDYSNFS